MDYKTQENKKLNEAIQMLKAFNFSLYWLDILIKLGYINKVEAGYIITLINKGGYNGKNKILY